MDAETKRKAGRPRSTTPEQLERVRDLLSKGRSVTTACHVAGITRAAWYAEVKRARALDVVAPISGHLISGWSDSPPVEAPDGVGVSAAYFRGAWHE